MPKPSSHPASQPASESFRYGLNEQFNKQTAALEQQAAATVAVAAAAAAVGACGVRDQR